MTKHTVIETPAGERLVLVPLADYEDIIARLEDAAEDAADVAAYDAAKAAPIEGEPRVLERSILEGYKVRSMRKRAGLTQGELAAMLGLTSQGFIADVEAGRRSLTAEHIKKLEAYKPTTPPAIKPIRQNPADMK